MLNKSHPELPTTLKKPLIENYDEDQHCHLGETQQGRRFRFFELGGLSFLDIVKTLLP